MACFGNALRTVGGVSKPGAHRLLRGKQLLNNVDAATDDYRAT
jgi:hypothetical protein